MFLTGRSTLKGNKWTDAHHSGPVSHTVDKSTKTGIVVDDGQGRYISPIFKGGAGNLPANYSLIS